MSENKCYIVGNLAICRLPVDSCIFFKKGEETSYAYNDVCHFWSNGRCSNAVAIIEYVNELERK